MSHGRYINYTDRKEKWVMYLYFFTKNIKIYSWF